MHNYLRLVTESGDPCVEQVQEEGFHSVEVGSGDYGISRVTNNPDTIGKPRSIQPLPCVFINIIHLSFMFGALVLKKLIDHLLLHYLP